MRIREILDKYDCKRDNYILDFNQNEYDKFFNKWNNIVPDEWKSNGIKLEDVPLIWLKVLDKVLKYLLTIQPTLKIFQIKIKFGGLRLYTNGDFDEPIEKELNHLEYILYDKKLIY